MNFPFPIVDAHVHFWNPAKLNYSWLARVPALSCAFLPEDYSAATNKSNVSKMVFVECGCAAAQSIDETNWISELAARETRLKGIVAQAVGQLLDRGLWRLQARGQLGERHAGARARRHLHDGHGPVNRPMMAGRHRRTAQSAETLVFSNTMRK